MKYFLLIMTLYCLFSTLKSLLKVRTGKEMVDYALKDKMPLSSDDKNASAIGMLIILIILSIYIILSITYVGTFSFTVIGFLYLLWGIFDFNNTISYIKENKVHKLFNNKVYSVLSKPVDLAFSIFIIYQIYIKWSL